MVALSSLAGAGWQFFGSNGLPLAGGKLFTYAAGTTTPLATYTSNSGLTAHTNPIILDSAGRVPNQVWLTTTLAYKFTLKTADDVEIWTKDNIPGLYDIDIAAASAAEAAASAAAAATSATSAGISAANAATSATTATTQAGAVAAALNSSNTPYPNAYASTLPLGVTSVAIGTAGTGGVAGTYALGVAGGPTGFAGTYTISGGGVTAITITNPGLSTSAALPTLSFPSGSVVGAAATATVSTLVLNQRTYWAASADSSQILLYGNNGGSVATAPFGGTQLVMYGKAAIDNVFASTSAPNILYDSFNQNTYDLPTLGGWNWYQFSGAVTWTQTSANIPIKTPVAQLAISTQFRKRWDWSRLGRRAGEAMRVSFLVYSAGLGGSISVQFRDSSGTAVGSAFTGSFVAGLSVATVSISAVPAGAIAIMDVSVSSSSAAFEVGGVFASVGTVVPSISTGAFDPQYGEAWDIAKNIAPNLPAINKSLVETWATVTGLTVTDGAFVNSTLWSLIGQTANASYRWTVYTLTGAEAAIRVTSAMSGTSTYQIVYTNALGQIIGREVQGTASIVGTTTIATPPVGAVQMYITGRTSAPLLVEVGSIGSTLGPRVVANSASIDQLKTWNDVSLTIIDNFYVDRFNASINAFSGFRYALVDFVALGITQLRVSSYVSGSSMALAVYVDAAGTFISSEFPGTTTATYINQVLTIPATAAKVYLGGRTSYPITAQSFGVGSLANTARMPVFGKRIGFLGNSFTNFGYYQPEVLRLTGCTQSFSTGYPGQDFGYLAGTAMPSVDLSATDIFMVTEGANEWGTGARPLGSVTDSAATNSTYGKLRSIIEQAYVKNPNILICFTGKTYSGKVWIAGAPGYVKDTDASANVQGVTGAQMDDAIATFCAYYDVTFIDWRGGGINSYTDGNASASSITPAVEVTWTLDGLHPTPSTASNGGGGPRIGRIAAAAVNRSC
jgi:hypothetical protein